MKMVESMPTNPKVKNYVKLEWSLVYSEENGIFTPNICKVRRETQVGVSQDVHIWKAAECGIRRY